MRWGYASFKVEETCPSKNNTKDWKSKQGKMRTKKHFRDLFAMKMVGLNLPCPIPRMEGTPLLVAVTIRFPPHWAGMERINYEPVIKECLADALWRSDDRMKQGWIDHDSDDQITLCVDIMGERGEKGMMVELWWVLPRDQQTDFDIVFDEEADDTPEFSLA